MKKNKRIINHLYIDWKEHPELDDLRAILKPMGVYVYASPMSEGSDTTGFVFSNKPLTTSEIKKYEKEEFGA